MAVGNKFQATTFTAAESLNVDTAQYHAFCADDSKLANNPEEAIGILMNKPNINEHATVGLYGEMKFAAGGTVTAGDQLTVNTSGWFTSCGSDDASVGEAKLSATSGSIGTGIFFFAGVQQHTKNFVIDVTAADAIQAGYAYALNDNKLANSGDEHTGCAQTAITSGSAGQVIVCGLAEIRGGGAALTAGSKLTVSTSGYYTAGDSGDFIVGMAIDAVASGTTGTAFIYAGNAYEGA